jgi:NAD(P)-dependent dehydrogenase (short-subunit alcohol dehydrogenase family)
MGFFPTAAVFPPSLSFTGQTILITGGTAGLGLETAIHYVQLAASTVIITARNAERGAAALATIEARTQKKGVVQVRMLDMGSFQNVKKFVDELERDVKTIDVVLLNAGVLSFDFEKSPDGWETDLQVNVLSTALLGLLLLPWMQAVKKDGQQQHLGIVGSGSHMAPDITVENWPKHDVLRYWNDEKNYEPGRASYARSKLLVQCAALELSKLAIGPNGRYD